MISTRTTSSTNNVSACQNDDQPVELIEFLQQRIDYTLPNEQ